MAPKEDGEEILADEPPTSINPYEILELEEKATTDEIKYAYRKQALKHHPDKAPPDQAEAANKRFQEIAFAYAILSDERRRRRYDQTGNTSESLDLEDDDFDWINYYKEQFSGMVDSNAIEKLKQEYQGSEDEKRDLLEAFERFKGSMNQIFENVMLSSILDDEERFRGIIDKAIKDGEAHPWPKYVNETEKAIKARRKRAQKEAAEAEELAEELEVDTGNDGKGDENKTKTRKKTKKAKKQPDQSDLAALIQQKQSTSSSFLDRLEAKYAQENGVGGRKKGKKGVAEDEPPEEAFAAVGARLEESKQAKKRKIPEADADEDDEERKSTRKSRRAKKTKA